MSSRALELAIRHKKLVDEVLEERKNYLAILEKEENNQSFLTTIASRTKILVSIFSSFAPFFSNSVEFFLKKFCFSAEHYQRNENAGTGRETGNGNR